MVAVGNTICRVLLLSFEMVINLHVAYHDYVTRDWLIFTTAGLPGTYIRTPPVHAATLQCRYLPASIATVLIHVETYVDRIAPRCLQDVPVRDAAHT